MRLECLRSWRLRALILCAAFAALGACATGQGQDGGEVAVEHRTPSRLVVDTSFEEVWPVAVAVVEGRGYEDVELERDEREETYTRTREVEDQPRDEQVRETVTEGRGRIVAATGDGRVVALALREQHHWGMGTLDILTELDGGDSRTLEHDGVEITVASGTAETVHQEETWAVLGAIRRRFEASE
ncbi:MAG: hypothetical protein U5K43_13670 [Halofilum sp. (in: g-proteobacteria)]|nr:hypothetical protein [Halofilum sp. (in: g-proteobacteria)]